MEQPQRRSVARSSLHAFIAVLLACFTLVVGVAPAQAVTPAPCDIAATASVPCVAAYSSVRALYTAYNGPLYQVTRQSDGTSTNISVLAAGGYANAAAQDTFCANTVCLVTKLYDQSSQHNDLTVAPVGLAGSADFGVRADALPVVAEGHNVYGLLFDAGTGFRKMVGSGVPTGSQPGVHVRRTQRHLHHPGRPLLLRFRQCRDGGRQHGQRAHGLAQHLDRVHGPAMQRCGPVVPGRPRERHLHERRSLEPRQRRHGLEQAISLTGALRNNGTTNFALDGGDATGATLTSLYSGALPSGYNPMLKEGGIVLGIGGDNSNAASGAFFEGAMTTGYMSNATLASIQTNIDAVNYTGTTGGGTGVPIAYPAGGQCIDVAGNDIGVNGAAVQIWSCLHDAVDQRWTTTNGLVSGPLKSLNRCLDVAGGGSVSGTVVQLYDCTGNAAQVWTQQANGTLLNPASGKCLTSPGGSTTNGTQLVIDTCGTSASQRFWVAYPARPINAPAGKCLDVAGANNGTLGTNVTISTCLREEVDQYWRQNPDQTIVSLGLCLDIKGNLTAPGTEVEIYTCNGVGGQKWVQQDNGAMLNPQSGLCLTAPATTNGTVLQIQKCTGAANQKFPAIGGQAYNSGGHPVTAPGSKCVDVLGDDQYGNWFGVNVQLWDCATGAADQHWIYKADDKTLRTLTRCLEIKGNSTTAGTDTQLFNCNGVGGQQWVPQADGTLKNPQSGQCLTATGGATANGTVLEIQPCTGAASQKFGVTPSVALGSGNRVSLQATTSCCTASYVRHASGNGLLSSIAAGSSAGDKADATWIVRPGLSNAACVSFESSNFANGYLRQASSQLKQQTNDGTAGFATDATFCPVAGLSGTGISLQWAGNSSLYIRHYMGSLYLASNGGANAWDTTTSWAQDASWSPVSAWTP